MSNFGDEVMCYSNVQEGESYILFMTNFEGTLSAKYDDIFGAAADYNVKNEAQVLQALGKSITLLQQEYLEIKIPNRWVINLKDLPKYCLYRK